METRLKTIVCLPAYNAEKTLERTFLSIPEKFHNDTILVDDFSKDRTIELSQKLGILTLSHARNKGYGANQKSCYKIALACGADIIVMLHPDFQYVGEDIPYLIDPIIRKKKDMMLGSRIRNARNDGMPLWKYFSNRGLTIIEKIVLRNLELHEFHSGFRAYSRRLLESIDFLSFNDDFSFDSQMIFSALKKGFRIGEIDTRTRYFNEASSIDFKKASKYAWLTMYLLLR